ncbi:HPr-rel-A system PqqD family peptide chaperone [Methylomarinum sp. Ch1-1]|uniref:HPr-rel-A system PqqD family peptide chaperone n=1 Tax=Methylomarinum roseum TaxID=3067653 RepID=A0AAU7NQD3_9GAMM|nr:HPr-rel-A system PqqD family peptide chaperone [Methylomarinum sp. Ch1-1]MDP4521226.1 HPr-rel-A system PqqD family peptide chaperone [Methylomarinum sp. Ch1-1]
MLDDRVWTVSCNSPIYSEKWADFFIIYHSSSGATHQLNGFAGEILTLIQKHPVTLKALLKEIEKIFDVEKYAEVELEVEKVLNDFHELGLIESVGREG